MQALRDIDLECHSNGGGNLVTPIAMLAAILIIMAVRSSERARTHRLTRLRAAQETWAEAQDHNGLTP